MSNTTKFNNQLSLFQELVASKNYKSKAAKEFVEFAIYEKSISDEVKESILNTVPSLEHCQVARLFFLFGSHFLNKSDYLGNVDDYFSYYNQAASTHEQLINGICQDVNNEL